MTQFYKQYKSIEPYLKNDNPPEKGRVPASDSGMLINGGVLIAYRRVPTVTGGPQEA